MPLESTLSYVYVIEAGKTEKQYWRDLWRFRELFFFLAWRDVLVRYKQTVIGVAWSVIRPLLTMLVFTFFNRLAHLGSSGAPAPIFIFAAIIPWQFFSNSLTESSQSLIANTNMVSKIYFPRLIVPSSTVLASLADFVISLGIFAVMLVWYHYALTIKVLLLPLFTVLAIVAASGCGLWLAALNVKYRDFRYIVPFVVQFGLYLSPIAFPSSGFAHNLGLFYFLNPMVGVIDGFRLSLIQTVNTLYMPGFLVSVGMSLFLFCSGLWYFRRTERGFADFI